MSRAVESQICDLRLNMTLSIKTCSPPFTLACDFTWNLECNKYKHWNAYTILVTIGIQFDKEFIVTGLDIWLDFLDSWLACQDLRLTCNSHDKSMEMTIITITVLNQFITSTSEIMHWPVSIGLVGLLIVRKTIWNCGLKRLRKKYLTRFYYISLNYPQCNMANNVTCSNF